VRRYTDGINEYSRISLMNMLLNADIGKLSHANNNRVERLNGTPKGSKCSENARNTLHYSQKVRE
jgi:hypothetical protein